VRVTGTVRQVRASRPGGPPALTAELGGGGDTVTVIWLGRKHIMGVEPGRVLAVEGTLSVQGGRKIIYNPRYELAADPAATVTGP
jgi:hypothetical protein